MGAETKTQITDKSSVLPQRIANRQVSPGDASTSPGETEPRKPVALRTGTQPVEGWQGQQGPDCPGARLTGSLSHSAGAELCFGHAYRNSATASPRPPPQDLAAGALLLAWWPA